MSRAMIRLAVVAAVWTAPAAAQALRPETPASAPRIEGLRAAWLRQDGAAIVGRGRVIVQLPGQGATAPLSPQQAARTVEALFRDATELGIDVVSVRTVRRGLVYSELRRRYRVRGARDTLAQSLFAAFRLSDADGQWELVELRAATPEPLR